MTHELLDKVGEVEAHLQSHAQFQDRMDRLTDWVVVTHQTIMTRGLNPVQAQVPQIFCAPIASQELTLITSQQVHFPCTQILSNMSSNSSQALEASMKDRKKDLEELLAHSIELQRRQQLLPQEKVPVSIVI